MWKLQACLIPFILILITQDVPHTGRNESGKQLKGSEGFDSVPASFAGTGTDCRGFPTVYFRKDCQSIDFSYSAGGDTNQQTLDYVVYFLRKNQYLVVEIASHLGLSDTPARVSSTKRGQAVYDYLLSRGIEPQRMVVKGYGKTKVRFSQTELSKLHSSAERETMDALNRRVVFRVLRTDYGVPDPRSPQDTTPAIPEKK